MQSNLVSIIIPVYNAEQYLEKCLDSVVKQSYKNIEIICINDGSTDNSLLILNSYQTRYTDKLIVKSILNGGQANARNVGMDLANGEFIMFVDSDDTILENMVEVLYQEICQKKCDIVVCEINRIMEGNANFLEKKFAYDTPLNIKDSTTIYEHPEIICYITAAPFAKLIKRSFLINEHIRFIKGYIYEDLVFTQSILAANPKICLVKDALYQYLVRDNSTMTSKKSKVSDMFVAYENFYKEYEKYQRVEDFKEELSFLCLYHVMIGTSYRMWRSGQYGLWQSLKECRKFVRIYDCKKKNKYLKQKGLFVRLFIVILL